MKKRTKEQIKDWKAEQFNRVNELLGKSDEEVKEIKGHRYSIRNYFWLLDQMEARGLIKVPKQIDLAWFGTFIRNINLKGFQQWKNEDNRMVQKGSKSYKIMLPCMKKDEDNKSQVAYYKTASIFEEAQTKEI